MWSAQFVRCSVTERLGSCHWNPTKFSHCAGRRVIGGNLQLTNCKLQCLTIPTTIWKLQTELWAHTTEAIRHCRSSAFSFNSISNCLKVRQLTVRIVDRLVSSCDSQRAGLHFRIHKIQWLALKLIEITSCESQHFDTDPQPNDAAQQIRLLFASIVFGAVTSCYSRPTKSQFQ